VRDADGDVAPNAAVEIQRAGSVALIGRPNVGKSTLVNALIGERIAIISHHAQTTRDRLAAIVTRGDMQFVFLDTPGVHQARTKLGERMNNVAKTAASDCDVAIFMTDIDAKRAASAVSVKSDAVSPPALRMSDEDRRILQSIPLSTPVVLVVNKVDRLQPKALLFPVLEGYASERNFAAIVPISARTGDGIDTVLSEVGKLLPEGPALYDPDELSDKPVRYFVGEFVREQVLRFTRQEVPHGVAVTVDSFEETSSRMRIAVTVHVAKDSHKGILIGNGGAMLKNIGRSARLRAEELLGHSVYLETFVRTSPGWFDDAGRLTEMGYADESPAKRKKTGTSKPAASASSAAPASNRRTSKGNS